MASILIIDDDPPTTVLLEKLLKPKGYQTRSVNESSMALQVAREYNPDLIILDLMMPDPDGFKVCRMLRAENQFIFTPVLIVTALDDTDSKIVAYGAGADAYIIKPYNIGDLLDTIKKLLRTKEN